MFALLAMPRTGSHLLQTGLDQHPEVEAYLEVLKRNRRYEVGGETSADYDTMSDFIRYMAEYEDRCGKHVGLITHIQAFMIQPVVIQTVNKTCDYAIRLTRENPLRRIASFVRAQKLSEWQVWAEDDDTPEPTTIHVSEAQFAYNMRIQTYHDDMHKVLPDVEVLEVSYEEQVADYQGTLNRLWSQMGLPSAPVEKKLKKQTRQPLHELIENYDEFASMTAAYDLEEYLP